MESNNEVKRRFSLEEDFMKYDTDDLVYGFMRLISTAKKINGEWKEYLLVKTFQQEKKAIQNICGTTQRTITNKVNKLIEKGLVEVGEMVENNITYSCYYFPYDYNGAFKLIDKDMIAYLIHTRNAQAIRIYLYLLNCFTYKENYVFTVKEIKTALGYADSTKSVEKIISDVLLSFQVEGLIKLGKKRFECFNPGGKVTTTERFVLLFVSTVKPQV